MSVPHFLDSNPSQMKKKLRHRGKHNKILGVFKRLINTQMQMGIYCILYRVAV